LIKLNKERNENIGEGGLQGGALVKVVMVLQDPSVGSKNSGIRKKKRGIGFRGETPWRGNFGRSPWLDSDGGGCVKNV